MSLFSVSGGADWPTLSTSASASSTTSWSRAASSFVTASGTSITISVKQKFNKTLAHNKMRFWKISKSIEIIAENYPGSRKNNFLRILYNQFQKSSTTLILDLFRIISSKKVFFLNFFIFLFFKFTFFAILFNTNCQESGLFSKFHNTSQVFRKLKYL